MVGRSLPVHLNDIEGMAIRHCVPIRDDVSAVIITHFDGGHNDDTAAVLWRIKVLVNFK